MIPTTLRRADIFVTDMCPHAENELLDMLKPLLRSGLMRTGALVVLTFKCGKGYSEAAWEAIARAQVAQLDGLLTGVTVLHLMANRLSERTLVGYVASAEV